jgi:hypothetical protein
MPFEVKTPALIEAIELARAAAEGVQTGRMERGDATVLNTAAGRMINAVGNEIKARLAAPKIAAQEAKLVEGEQARRLTAMKEAEHA